jgi:pimeloyl-ACP methyl ester carboxylesterase
VILQAAAMHAGGAPDDPVMVSDATNVPPAETCWPTAVAVMVSGGGPHAFALGVRAAERIAALGVVSGAVPPDLEDPESMDAVMRETRRRAHEEGRASLEGSLAAPAAQLASNPARDLDTAIARAAPIDRELLRQRRAELVESMREAFANGPFGWFDDLWVLLQPWQFDLRDVAVPVRLCRGELEPARAIERMAAQLAGGARSRSFPARATAAGACTRNESSARCWARLFSSCCAVPWVKRHESSRSPKPRQR